MKRGWNKLGFFLRKNKKSNSHSQSDIKIKLLPDCKRSQITIFLIISIVIVLSIILIILLKSKISEQKQFSEITRINNELNDCFQQRSLDAVYLIGLQGGYVNLPSPNLKTGISSTAYGLKDNKNILLSIQKIQDEISGFLGLTLPFCLNSGDYPELEINFKNINTNTKILDKITTESVISLSVSSITENKSFILDKTYQSEIPIRLKQIHETANQIIKKHLENHGFIDLTFLTEQDFDITFSHYDDNTLIYIITDFESSPEITELNELEETAYSFVFVVEGK